METFQARNSGMGVFLPSEAGEVVNSWRRLYDPSYEHLAPHITLAYPPFVSPEEWPRVKPVVVAALGLFQPFQIVLKETGVFLGNPNVLWLNPEDGGILGKMRLAFEAALPVYVPRLPFDYQPHVSVGFFQNLEALQIAKERVDSELVRPIRFEVDELHYGFQKSENGWVIYDTIQLFRMPNPTREQ